MKRFIRILSVSLAAILLLSVAGVSFAAKDTPVYIPGRVAKLGLPDMPDYLTLKTKTERAVMKDRQGNKIYQTETWSVNGVEVTFPKYDYNGNPIPVYGIVDDAKIELQFSDKPDWAGVIWADGYETLSLDESGYAATSMEGHRLQPGINVVKSYCDPMTGRVLKKLDDGDYAYLAGKDNVTVQYGRSGKVNYVEYTVDQDFFRTGMEGASTVIRWEPVEIPTDCYEEEKSKICYLTWCLDPGQTPVNGYPSVTNPGRTPVESFQTNVWGNIAINENNKVCYCLNGKMNLLPTDGSCYYDPQTYILYDHKGNILAVLPAETCCDDKVPPQPYDPGYNPDTCCVQIPVICKGDAVPLTVWYISRVTATYPTGNYIVEVEADWRNDEKKSLASYKVSYEPKKGEIYKITYSPSTTTILENHNTGEFYPWISDGTPSTNLESYIKKASGDREAREFRGVYLHHYTEDEVLSGLYTSGDTILCSGSGKNLKKWYKYYGTEKLENGIKVNNNGKQVRKNGLKPCTYFISPRVVD